MSHLSVAATMRELAELRDMQLDLFAAQMQLEISAEDPALYESVDRDEKDDEASKAAAEDRFGERVPDQFARLGGQLNDLHSMIDGLSAKMEEVSRRQSTSAAMAAPPAVSEERPVLAQVPLTAVTPSVPLPSPRQGAGAPSAGAPAAPQPRSGPGGGTGGGKR